MKSHFLALALCPVMSSAETYLCVSEAGAAVIENGSGKFESGTLGVDNSRYVVSNESGKWNLKILGQNVPYFDKCQTQYICERSEGYGGTFFMDAKKGTFTIVLPVAKGDSQILYAEMGRCSKL